MAQAFMSKCKTAIKRKLEKSHKRLLLTLEMGGIDNFLIPKNVLSGTNDL